MAIEEKNEKINEPWSINDGTVRKTISELTEEERIIFDYFLDSTCGTGLLEAGYSEELPVTIKKYPNLGYLLNISLSETLQYLQTHNIREIEYHSFITPVRSDVAIVRTKEMHTETIYDDSNPGATKEGSSHSEEHTDFVHMPFRRARQGYEKRIAG